MRFIDIPGKSWRRWYCEMSGKGETIVLSQVHTSTLLTSVDTVDTALWT